MKVAVFGGTGGIGRQLVRYLHRQGTDVAIISRSAARSKADYPTYTWEQLNQTPELLQDYDAWVNLAGESINQRWTKSSKERIVQSRLASVERMKSLVERLDRKPEVIVSGSAIGVYGTSLTETFTETSVAANRDFLSSVVEQWEQAASTIQGAKIVLLRTGVVLDRNHGALPKMALPYKLFAGGKVGSGKQWLSWIHIDDLVRIIECCIANENFQGPINATAPTPMTNDEFGRTLGKVLRRPHIFPVPAVAMKLLFGEMSGLLLEGQRVIPQKLIDHGFPFKYAELEPALLKLFKS